MPYVEWSVYEHEIGQVWNVTPPTQARAEEEAALAGPGHEALPRTQADAMRNAWCAGQFAGIESMRAS